MDDEVDDDSYQGEENMGNDSDTETKVGSVSCETRGQWQNMSLAECMMWRQGNALADIWDLMQWQVEVTERQEELLWEQANSLSQMADAWEKSVGMVMKFSNTMELFAHGDHYMWTQEMGRLS